MDPSPNSMSFRKRNYLGGKRIAAPKQLEVSDYEANNGGDQFVDNVINDDKDEDDDCVYEISASNGDQRNIYATNRRSE